MPKYFASGTRLEWLERMMMDPSRTASGDGERTEPESGKRKFPKREPEKEDGA